MDKIIRNFPGHPTPQEKVDYETNNIYSLEKKKYGLLVIKTILKPQSLSNMIAVQA